MPKLEYPVHFNDQTMGFRAKEQIDHREMIMAVPYSIVMSAHKAKADPKLGKIIAENPIIFDEAPKNNHNNMVLIVFLMYEIQKGSDSFWAPYLEYLP